MREARDVQLLASWIERLASWEYTQDVSDHEPAVAEALLRLADSATERLRGTGQGNGITRQSLTAAGTTITYLITGEPQ